MTISVTISLTSQDELPLLTKLLSGLNASTTSVEANAESDHEQAENDADESDSPATRESTRERGLGIFFNWAQGLGLRVRRSSSREHGTFIVGAETKEWPVEVICSKRPRISLRKQWAQPEDLVLAYVWLEDRTISLMRYVEAEAHLEGAAFTGDGFYTKALSPNRKLELRPFGKSLEISEESAVATLMETGAFGDVSEAREYFHENGLPGIAR